MIDALNAYMYLLDWLSIGGLIATVVATLVLAHRAWTRQFRMECTGWLAIAIGLTGSALIDGGLVRPLVIDHELFVVDSWHVSTFEAGAASATIILGSFLLRQVWRCPIARWCIVVAIVSALTNPLTESAEHQLVSNPQNYAFVATNQPYRFRSEPSLQLARISTLQELSENLSIFMLLIGVIQIVYRPDSNA